MNKQFNLQQAFFLQFTAPDLKKKTKKPGNLVADVGSG